MDSLHATLAALRTETKSEKDHLTVFREFLAQLDELQRHTPAKAPRIKRCRGASRRGAGGARSSRVPGAMQRAASSRRDASQNRDRHRSTALRAVPALRRTRFARRCARPRPGRRHALFIIYHPRHPHARAVAADLPPRACPRWRDRGLCQPVRRDRPGARHGDARRVHADAEGNAACARSRCCSSTILPSRSASGSTSPRTGAG